MNIYLACGLTHVDRSIFQEYVQFIYALYEALAQRGHAPRCGLIDGEAQIASLPESERARMCYALDRRMVEESSLVVAEVSFPSIGVGVELQIANQMNVPILLCYRDHGANRSSSVKFQLPNQAPMSLQVGKGFISLMALGIPGVARVIEYDAGADGISAICLAVDALADGRSHLP